MKCDVCDEEFDTENQLLQHKAQMHAGEAPMREEPKPKDIVDAREVMMPRPEDETAEDVKDEDLEEPDFPRAANE
jgi:hypothetical protein